MPVRFEVYVVPRSPRPGPDGRHGGVPRLRLAAPPVEGRANAEVEKALTRILGVPVRLVGGGSGRRKILEADIDPEALGELLTTAFGARGSVD